MAGLTREQVEQIVKEAREKGERPNLSGAKLSRANLSGANLSRAKLSGANFSGANLSRANLSRANLSEANLSGANLSRADLSGAHLSEANLIEADLSRANLIEANLSEADLSRANLSWANLSRANLSGADIFGAKLFGANLSRADLFGAYLSGANLSEVDLGGADLGRADLGRANLRGADLRGANLSGAKLGATVFADVDFSEVQGLDTVKHYSPSYIDTRTLTKSKGNIPIKFLRDCGLSDWEIEVAKLYRPHLTLAQVTDITSKILEFQAGESEEAYRAFNRLIFPKQKLTPDSLINTIAPDLKAVADLQHLVEEIRNRPQNEVEIVSLTRGSVSASVGGVAQAIELIMSVIVPWRYKHAQKMAQLAEGEKQAAIKKARAEILAQRLRNRKDQERAKLEFEQKQAEVEKLHLENEKLGQELQRANFQLALDVLKEIKPELPEVEKANYLTQLMEPLKVLTTSELEPTEVRE